MVKRTLFLFFLMVSTGIVFAQQKIVTVDQAIGETADNLFQHLGYGKTVIFTEFKAPHQDVHDYIIKHLKSRLNDKGITVLENENKANDIVNQKLVEGSIVTEDLSKDFNKKLQEDYGLFGAFKEQGEDYVMTFEAIVPKASSETYHCPPMTIRMDYTLAELLHIKWVDTYWRNKWLWVDAWVGMNTWKQIAPDISFGVQVSALYYSKANFDFSAGVEIGMQRVFYKERWYVSYDKYIDTVNYASVATLTAFPVEILFRPQIKNVALEVGVAAGFYLNIPSDVPVMWNDSSQINDPAPFGIVIGGDVGVKLGPGVVFIDGRYGFWRTELRFLSFGAGYKVGLFEKKKK